MLWQYNYEGLTLIHDSLPVDLNECERQNGGCEHECLNTVGSFQCTLPDPEDDVLDDEDDPVPLCEDMEICGTVMHEHPMH